MPDTTIKSLPPMPFSRADAALRAVPAPPRFRGGTADTAKFTLPAPPAGPLSPKNGGASEDRRLREATEQFEAFFVGYLLKQMRQGALEDSGLLAPSQGEKIFRDMMDDELARSMSKTRQMGIADLLYQQLAPTRDTKKTEADR